MPTIKVIRNALLLTAIAVLGSLWTSRARAQPDPESKNVEEGGPALAAWFRAQEAPDGSDPRQEILVLLGSEQWSAAEAACREWLADDASAAWPTGILAELHERAGYLGSARALAMRAETLYLASAGKPSLDLEYLTRRIEAALKDSPELRKLPEPYLGDLKWIPAIQVSTAPASGLLVSPPASGISATVPESAVPSMINEPAATANPSTTTVPSINAAPAAPVGALTLVPLGEIDESRFLLDTRGQWASKASASSEYGSDRYNAMQATGAPNVASYSDNPNAWCHSGRSVPFEWLEVEFPNAVRAIELRVRQSNVPGALSKVEIFAADGTSQILWEGADPNRYPPREISWFVLRFPPTEFPVSRVRLTLNMTAVSGWKQIDAVQLVGGSRQ